MKRIPYGISDYKKLIENGNYYVDKTMYLEKLENVADTLLYLRPRRFGKTLLTSMMYYYYDINSKNFFDTLFKQVRVDNTLARFNKSIVRDILGVISNFKNFVLDSKYGKYANFTYYFGLFFFILGRALGCTFSAYSFYVIVFLYIGILLYGILFDFFWLFVFIGFGVTLLFM